MADVTYANVIDQIQANVYTILNADSTIKNYAEKIIDGLGTIQEQLTGYGKVRIRAPEVNEKRIIMGARTVYHLDVDVEIECITRSEGNVRKLADAVRNALKTAQYASSNASVAWNMSWFKIGKCSKSALPLDDKTTEYTYAIPLSYQVVVS